MDGVFFLTATWDQGVGRRLFVGERRREIRLLARVVQILVDRGLFPTDSVFVDVGANIGTTTLPALVTHGFRRAVAIEPEPSNARILCAAAALNDAQDRLTVLQAAAAGGDGPAALKLHRRNSGGHRLIPSVQRLAPAGRPDALPVRAAALETLLAEAAVSVEDVGLLWIDAQGSEEAIVRAAPGLMGSVPAVIEVTPARWRALADVVAAYEIAIDLRSGQTVERAGLEPRGSHTDVLLIPPRRASEQRQAAEAG